jgi:NAD-dependent DNA ligase
MNTDLYNRAKEAYYNGNPIMSDQEFDELEKSLGLENKGYIGTVNNVSYTVTHPVLMGSLSKIQIKEDKDSQIIQFDKYFNELKKYMDKTEGCPVYEITPKFDGASIELVFDHFGILLSASTRGDGKHGKDISIWYQTDYDKNKSIIKEICRKF